MRTRHAAGDNELDQRFGLFKRYHFVLDGEEIAVSIRTLQVKRKYRVRLTTILETPSEETAGQSRLLWLTVLLSIFSLIALWMAVLHLDQAKWDAPLFWGIGALIAGTLYGLSRKTVLAFSTDDYPLVFIRNKPSIAAVDAFVARAQSAARDLVRMEVLSKSGDADDHLARLKWLLEKKIIGRNEYVELRRKVLADRRDAEGSHDDDDDDDGSDDDGKPPLVS